MNRNILESFIVLEGLDGAGTTTQLKLIEQKLQEQQIPHFCTFEPTDGKIGLMIRDILKTIQSVHPDTVALLFAADRNEHLYGKNGIVERIRRGELVISDRYLFSSLAYQSIQCGFDYVYALNSKFPLPKQMIFIDTPFEICQERLKQRKSSDLYDIAQFQKKVRENYSKLIDKFSGMQVHIVDGSKSAEILFKDVWKIITSLPILNNDA